jgi:hypothetical protein
MIGDLGAFEPGDVQREDDGTHWSDPHTDPLPFDEEPAHDHGDAEARSGYLAAGKAVHPQEHAAIPAPAPTLAERALAAVKRREAEHAILMEGRRVERGARAVSELQARVARLAGLAITARPIETVTVALDPRDGYGAMSGDRAEGTYEGVRFRARVWANDWHLELVRPCVRCGGDVAEQIPGYSLEILGDLLATTPSHKHRGGYCPDEVDEEGEPINRPKAAPPAPKPPPPPPPKLPPDHVRDATERRALARAREMEHEHRKPAEKEAAIQRLVKLSAEAVEQERAADPTTKAKPLSVSRAEELAETEGGYVGFLAAYREAVVQRIRADGDYQATLLSARVWAEQGGGMDGFDGTNGYDG